MLRLRSRVTLLASMIATSPPTWRKAWASSMFSCEIRSRISLPWTLAGEKNSEEEVDRSVSSLRRSSPLLKMRTRTPSISRVRPSLRAMVDLPRAGRPTMTITSFPFIAVPPAMVRRWADSCLIAPLYGMSGKKAGEKFGLRGAVPDPAGG